MWRAAPQRGSDRDSCYAYVLLCSHFSDTGVVAEQDGQVAGFALGYRPPIRPAEAFVWQLGVSEGQELSELFATDHPDELLLSVGPLDP